MKVAVIVGTRPDAIKMVSIIKLLRQRTGFKTVVIASAQHREMLDQVLSVFDISLDDDLNVMQDNQSLAYLTSSICEKMDAVITSERPDWILVQGDTTTSFASALTAFYHKVKIGHVEAGLRTYSKYGPFPEEMNRRLISAIADVHFAPTVRAKENLLQEGIPEETILVTGNTVIDALLKASQMDYCFDGQLKRILAEGKKIILVTAHRRESFGAPLEQIRKALCELATSRRNDLNIVYIVHPNPNVQNTMCSALSGYSNIHLIAPLDYLPFVHLMKSSYLILTDSGGLQEEAPVLGKPVLVMREKTERPEAIEAGVAKLVGARKDGILKEVLQLLDNPEEYARMAKFVSPFGDGKAAQRIIDFMAKRGQ